MKWYHYIYKIVCKSNGMLYYGVHSTKDLEDGYFGSGAELNRAKKLYGIENFHKEILCFCDTREKALEVERLIVHKDDSSNLNRKEGGTGGISSYDIEERVFEADEEEVPYDDFRECFQGMKGKYSVEDLWNILKRNPHWHESFADVKEFRKRLEKEGIFHRELKGNLKCVL